MRYKIFIYTFMLLYIFSCKENNDKQISFYQWKANAVYSKTIADNLKKSNCNKIYLHYFDIFKKDGRKDFHNGIYPTYALKNVAPEFKNFEIVPVIYIVNNVFKDIQKTDNHIIKKLVVDIQKLTNQISEKHFNRKITSIQIDCDWSESTKHQYFEFLKQLSEHYSINATIRLHQIKFQEKTGIPPVDNGTLMLYNMGNMKSYKENSIIENNIVKKYINKNSSYPLKLDIALPIFSQTIITNNDDKVKIIKNNQREVLETDNHFKKIDEKNYLVKKDTLFKGFYLTEGYNLKIEETTEKEIIDSYKTIKNSKLKTNEIIFYHLDENSLTNINMEQLIEKL